MYDKYKSVKSDTMSLFSTKTIYMGTLGCTRPPQSQYGALFCHLYDHCVVFKSVRQFWEKKNHRKGMTNTLQIMHLEPHWQINWPKFLNK